MSSTRTPLPRCFTLLAQGHPPAPAAVARSFTLELRAAPPTQCGRHYSGGRNRFGSICRGSFGVRCVWRIAGGSSFGSARAIEQIVGRGTRILSADSQVRASFAYNGLLNEALLDPENVRSPSRSVSRRRVDRVVAEDEIGLRCGAPIRERILYRSALRIRPRRSTVESREAPRAARRQARQDAPMRRLPRGRCGRPGARNASARRAPPLQGTARCCRRRDRDGALVRPIAAWGRAPDRLCGTAHGHGRC